MYETNHVEHPLFCFIVYVIEVGMLVPHVTVQIELLELGESTEAEEAEDLLAKVVAEVAVAPNLRKNFEN